METTSSERLIDYWIAGWTIRGAFGRPKLRSITGYESHDWYSDQFYDREVREFQTSVMVWEYSWKSNECPEHPFPTPRRWNECGSPRERYNLILYTFRNSGRKNRVHVSIDKIWWKDLSILTLSGDFSEMLKSEKATNNIVFGSPGSPVA